MNDEFFTQISACLSIIHHLQIKKPCFGLSDAELLIK